MISRSSFRRSRPGFTLIELLVVISILVVLIGLTTSAVMNFRLTGPRLATRSQIANMKAALDTQWQSVRDKAQKDSMTGVTLSFPPTDPRARAQFVQLRLAQAFPVSFDEVMNPGTNNLLPAWPAYATYLMSNGVTAANAKTITSVEVQQAVCLMMALERGPSNAGTITAASLGTTGAKQLVLRDGKSRVWGCVDAFDPRPETGVPPLPSPNPQGLAFQTQPGGPLLFTRTANGTPLTPAILSAGPDMNYGVDTTTFAPSPAGNPFINDNLHAP